MSTNSNIETQSRSRLSLRGDVNGLILVLGMLVALLLLPGPTGAEYQANDAKMNDLVIVDYLKK